MHILKKKYLLKMNQRGNGIQKNKAAFQQLLPLAHPISNGRATTSAGWRIQGDNRPRVAGEECWWGVWFSWCWSELWVVLIMIWRAWVQYRLYQHWHQNNRDREKTLPTVCCVLSLTEQRESHPAELPPEGHTCTPHVWLQFCPREY